MTPAGGLLKNRPNRENFSTLTSIELNEDLDAEKQTLKSGKSYDRRRSLIA